jgi:metacaspase-1
MNNYSNNNTSRFLSASERREFEAEEPPELRAADIWMISGCEDAQTSSDVSNVKGFELPDPAGRAGGACTATLLSVLYENEKTPLKEYTFADVMESMRQILKQKGFHQIPQLSSTRPISLGDTPFKIVPDAYQELPGATKRAVLIGINYRGHTKGELRGCHNDAFNMVRIIY